MQASLFSHCITSLKALWFPITVVYTLHPLALAFLQPMKALRRLCYFYLNVEK